MNLQKHIAKTIVIVLALFVGACGGGSISGPIIAPPPADITTTGSIYDGPVAGGSLFVFDAAGINQAQADAAAAEDRAAALAAASPLAILTRDPANGSAFTLAVSGDLADQALFFVFDAAGAEDEAFGDQPFNMEAVAVAAAAGSTLRINVTPHTTLTAMQVRSELDGSATGAAVQTARDTAWASVLATFGQSSLGEDLFPAGEDAHNSTDLDVLAAASSEIGFAVRAAAVLSGLSANEVVYLFAADAADGVLDGSAPVAFGLTTEQEAALAVVADAQALGGPDMADMEMLSCSAGAASLRRACEFEVLDEFFTGVAICAHSESAEEAAGCVADYALERDEVLDECGEVTMSRLELCGITNDAPHDPPFGMDFAANFIDPRTIGSTAPLNPYLPLVQGNEWVYEGTFEEDGEMVTETITITVTDRTKLIDGVRCLVVRDVVEVDGELVEDTDDWFAQDIDGNVWYCGEEAKDYEYFEGDMPTVPELVAIDGSFKAGNEDGDEAGILLPATPVVGDIFRQEVSFANAEDVIEIIATDGSETVPAASCIGTCLVTRDFSPLDPGVEENKYYAPGIGKILEIDLETGDRFELVSMSIAQ